MRTTRGSALLALASAGDTISLFAVSVLVARMGGPTALGRLAAATAWLLVGVTATELGQNVVLTRRTAAGEANARAGLGASLLLKTAGGLLLFPILVFLWPRDEPIAGAGVALLYLVLSSLTISGTAVLRGRERFATVAAASLAGALTAVGLMAWQRPTGLSGVLAVLGAAQVLKAAVVFAALPAGSRPARPRVNDVRRLVRETLPFAALVLVSVAYLKADILLLPLLAGMAEAGRYAGATRLIEAARLVPAAVGAALFPALAAGREEELARALRAIALFALATIATALFGGQWALAAIFGPRFSASAGPLRVLVWVFAASAINGLLILVLYARRQERLALRCLGAALLANLAGNLLFVPHAGASGAAVAALVSEGLLGMLYVRALGRREAVSAVLQARESWS